MHKIQQIRECRHEVLIAQIAGNVIVSYKCRECGVRFSPQPVPFEPKPIEVVWPAATKKTIVNEVVS